MANEINPQSDILRSLSDQKGNILYEWTALNDFTTEKNLNWTISMILLEFIFILFAIITKQWLLVFILVGIAVITYVISRYPSHEIHNVITTLGVIIDNKMFKWSELEAFWILREPYHLLLGFESKRRIYKEEIILIDNEDPQELIKIISQYLPLKEKEIPLLDVFLEAIGFQVRMIFGKIIGKKRT